MARLYHCDQWVSADLDGNVYKCPECGNAITTADSVDVDGQRIRAGDAITIRACDGRYGPLTVTEVTESKIQMLVEPGVTPALYLDSGRGVGVLEGHGGDPVDVLTVEGGEDVPALADLAELIRESTAAQGVDVYAVEEHSPSAAEWAAMTGRDRSTVSRNISRASE